MKREKRSVLVTGATGQQGGAVAHALLERGHSVHALTRKPESSAARELREQGAKIVRGSFDEHNVCSQAMSRVDAVFAVTTPFESGSEQEIRDGQMLVDVAREAGIKHFVLTSVASADKNTKIPHFDSKYKVETHLRQSDVPWTVIAPVFFMENFRSPWLLPSIQKGTLAMALPAKRKLQMVAVADIGAFATAVFEDRDEFLGKRIEIASDELSGERAAEILSKASKHTISYRQTPIAELRAQSEDLAAMFEWFDQIGYSIDIAGLKKRYKKVKWHEFDKWAKAQNWKRLLEIAPAA